MKRADAMQRLAGCRAAQPDALQVLVGAEIVDALLGGGELVCVYCGAAEGHSLRCAVTKHGAPEHMEPE